MTTNQTLADEIEGQIARFQSGGANGTFAVGAWFIAHAERIAAALRAQPSPAPEPDAWMYTCIKNDVVSGVVGSCLFHVTRVDFDPRFWTETPLWKHPPKEPDRERVAYVLAKQNTVSHGFEGYAAEVYAEVNWEKYLGRADEVMAVMKGEG